MRVLRSGWLVAGENVRTFERAIAAHVGASHAVACANGTCALEVALRVCGIGPGDGVVVPSFTCIACPNAIHAAGATPVFCDVDPGTYNVTADSIAARLTTLTRAILVVHQFGLPAPMEEIEVLAGERGLIVIEDAACALGSRARGRPVGGRGNVTCFSFHPRKVLTTGEGGVIALADGARAQAARRLIDHGGRDRAEIGHNYRLTDIQGAIGVVQMSRLDDIVRRRNELATRYTDALSGIGGLVLPQVPEGVEPNWQSYVVRVTGDGAESRDELAVTLARAQIETRPGTIACHREPAYATGDSLPVSESLAATTLTLPLYPGMESDRQDRVIETAIAALSS